MRVIACSVLPPPDATNVAYAFQEETAERIGTEESSGVVEQAQAEGLEEKVVDTQLYPDLNLSQTQPICLRTHAYARALAQRTRGRTDSRVRRIMNESRNATRDAFRWNKNTTRLLPRSSRQFI